MKTQSYLDLHSTAKPFHCRTKQLVPLHYLLIKDKISHTHKHVMTKHCKGRGYPPEHFLLIEKVGFVYIPDRFVRQ